MRKFLLIIVLLVFNFHPLFSQKLIPYQGIVRNDAGTPIINSNISVRISIIDSISNGNVLYIERHNCTTNLLGLFNIKIGEGTVDKGSYNTIDWGANPKYIQTEIDSTAIGLNYENIGIQQFNSVPYALYAFKTLSNSDSLNYLKKIYMQSDSIYSISNHGDTNSVGGIKGKDGKSIDTSFIYNDSLYFIYNDKTIQYVGNLSPANSFAKKNFKKGNILYWNGTDVDSVEIGKKGLILQFNDDSTISWKQPSPIARFNYSTESTGSNDVGFTNYSMNSSSYYWDFGDNSTSLLTDPRHTYNSNGYYNVKLVATNSNGEKDSIIQTIYVENTTTIKIYVYDGWNFITKTKGATVKLYKSYSDYINSKNQIGVDRVTDTTGSVTYNGLDNGQYFFRIINGCQDNNNNTIRTANIVSNSVNSFHVVLNSLGGITIRNNYSNAINVLIDNNLSIINLKTGTSQTISNLFAGSRTVRIIDAFQINGQNPIDTTFTVTVPCGGITSVIVP